jgi:arginase
VRVAPGEGAGDRLASAGVPEVQLLSWPFHGGLAGVAMGAGPRVLAADEGFRAAVGDGDVHEVAPVDEGRPEVARIIELDRRLAVAVRAAAGAGAFPFVLAGNCASCLGTVGGIGAERLGVVWFDAHADFDTPDENLSGFFDVMALSALTGGSWQALAATVPGFAPVDPRDVVLAGVRDLEPYQRDTLDRSAVRTVPGAIDRDDLRAALDDLAARVDRVYLHVDIDVLDAAAGRANEYAAPGGPDLSGLLAALEIVTGRLALAAAAITAYDPACDEDGRVLEAARRVAAQIA